MSFTGGILCSAYHDKQNINPKIQKGRKQTVKCEYFSLFSSFFYFFLSYISYFSANQQPSSADTCRGFVDQDSNNLPYYQANMNYPRAHRRTYKLALLHGKQEVLCLPIVCSS